MSASACFQLRLIRDAQLRWVPREGERQLILHSLANYTLASNKRAQAKEDMSRGQRRKIAASQREGDKSLRCRDLSIRER